MGMRVSVYKFPMGDCTNHGISSGVSELTLVNVNGPSSESDTAPAALLDLSSAGVLRVVPAIKDVDGNWVKPHAWCMMGGNFAYTSDSRFSAKCRQLLGSEFYGAVAIHDRIE